MAALVRRTNEERTEATRRRLLDAAIDCLMTVGYAQTTTVEVSKRAGVSRGAQLHHFPTRADLVTAAVKHLFRRRQQEFRAVLAKRSDDDLVDAAIDTLWQIMSGPTFYAWLEILVASRTDTVLREHVTELARRSDVEMSEMVEDIFHPPKELRDLIETVSTMLFGMMTGLAAERIALDDDRRITDSIVQLKRLIHAVFP